MKIGTFQLQIRYLALNFVIFLWYLLIRHIIVDNLGQMFLYICFAKRNCSIFYPNVIDDSSSCFPSYTTTLLKKRNGSKQIFIGFDNVFIWSKNHHKLFTRKRSTQTHISGLLEFFSPYNHKSFIECSVFVLVSMYLLDLSKMNEKWKCRYKIRIMQCSNKK